MKPIIALTILVALLAACSPAAPTQPSETPTNTTDPNLEQGPVYINSVDLLVAESYPVQPRLHITGDLPTPCHQFRADVAAPNAQNQIHVTAYSLSDPSLMCAQMLEPFDENVAIPMAGAADGSYSVYLNGELVGEFNYPG